MPRIRNLTVAGVLAGATVLGGAGLAGATDSDEQVQERESTEVDLLSQAPDDPSTGEADAPTAPDLPAEAADEARDALEAAFGGEQAEDEIEVDDAAEDAETTEDEGPPADTHGATVSEVARSGEPGPDHGQNVSEVARQNGDAERGTEREDEAETETEVDQTQTEDEAEAEAEADEDAGAEFGASKAQDARDRG